MDEELRRIQREAAQGDPGARSRFLLERVRRGVLGRERLVLAAFLGHDEAAAALEPSEAPSVPDDPVEWVRALEPFGREVCLRAGLVAARVNYATPGAEHEVSDRLIEALDAAEAWLEGQAEQQAVRAALGEALTALFKKPRTSFHPRVFNGGRASVSAVGVALHPSTLLNPHYPSLIEQSLGLRAYTYSLGTLAAAAFYWTAATALMTRVDLREHLRERLLDWALMG